MKKIIDRRPYVYDSEHMRQLHREAISQLELMQGIVKACQEADSALRDSLETMYMNHWHAYLDLVHMVCLHDEEMAGAMKRYGMPRRDFSHTAEGEQRLPVNRMLLLLLLVSLIQRHDRFINILSMRNSPMSDYLQESMIMEREHTAELIALVNSIA